MIYIGAHVSSAGGLEQAVLRAHSINATAFAIFVKNQLQWHSAPLTQQKINIFTEYCVKYNFLFDKILPHSSYLINLGHPENSLLTKSRMYFIDEILRCDQLSLRFLNVHPGSHLNKISERECLSRISESINIALDKTKNIIVLIENTAGQGTNVGYCFEHLSDIIDQVDDKSRIGICLDTCHLFAAGYDLRTKRDCIKTFKHFFNFIDLKYLKAFHLNDSKKPINSHIDRHNSLGFGEIGISAFQWIVRNKNFNHLPMILETINPKMWQQEISWLQSWHKV